MKLSEAGLLGAMGTDTCENHLLFNGKTCFLGGALIAIGAIGTEHNVTLDQETRLYNILKKTWPILEKTVIDPHYNEPGSLMSAIWSANDTLKWTRAQTAEWVSQQEAIIEATQVKDLLMPTSHEQEVSGKVAIGQSVLNPV